MEYLTLSGGADAEYVVNRSRFIAHASPVENAEAANAFISEVRAAYPDATHNVYAFQVRQPEYARYSDDGEPSGTSGMPVLQVLRGNGLTNSIIVVTRYFGGVLLGTGGLARAYSHAAALGVEAAGIVRMCQCARLFCACPYPYYERVSKLVEKRGGVIEDTAFEEAVKLTFRLKTENAAAFHKELTELSGASVSAAPLGEKYDKFPV